MKILQFRKLIRIHWLLLILIVAGVAWPGKLESVVTAQSTQQRFSVPSNWVNAFAMEDGWGPEYPRQLADINGDGRKDLVGFGINGVWRSLAPPSNNLAFAIDNFGYDQGWRTDKHVRLMGDVNGDHMDDIVGFGSYGVFTAHSNGSTFGPTNFPIAGFGYDQGWRVEKHVRLLADINGDGRKDILGFGEHGVWASISSSTNGDFAAPFFAVSDFGYIQGWRNDKHIRTTADINGDGRQDIVGFGEYGIVTALSTGNGFAAPQFVFSGFAVSDGGWKLDRHLRMMEDMNNDGRADIVGFGEYGVWVALSNGAGFAPAQMVSSDFACNTGWIVNLHPRYIADLNGDGYKDIVGFGQESVYRQLGGPNGFFDFRGVLREMVAADYPFGQNYYGPWAPQFVGDVNGDNMADLVVFGQSHVQVALSSNQPPIPGPKAPVNVRIRLADETSMVIDWDDVSNNERRFFTWFGKPGDLRETIRDSQTETAVYTDLKPDTEYCFSVQSENIWGVSPNTYPVCGKTQPKPEPTPAPTPEPFGYSQAAIWNCNSGRRPIYIWTLDTSQNVWVPRGTVNEMWKDGGCPAGAAPFTFPLQDGHSYWIVAVDPGLSVCNGQNNPNLTSCQRSISSGPVLGKSTGPAWANRVD